MDTSKTVPSSRLTAVAGDTLSVRRMYSDPASERHLKASSAAQSFGRSQGANAGGDWCVGHEDKLLLYLRTAIFLNALQISVELIQCTEEKADLEMQKT